MQKTQDRLAEPREPEGPGDYFVVGTQFQDWYVSRDMARFVEACMDQVPLPRWIAFVDLTGARVRLRSRLVLYICQCTAEQRAQARAYGREQRREEKEERDWNEDD